MVRSIALALACSLVFSLIAYACGFHYGYDLRVKHECYFNSYGTHSTHQ